MGMNLFFPLPFSPGLLTILQLGVWQQSSSSSSSSNTSLKVLRNTTNTSKYYWKHLLLVLLARTRCNIGVPFVGKSTYLPVLSLILMFDVLI